MMKKIRIPLGLFFFVVGILIIWITYLSADDIEDYIVVLFAEAIALLTARLLLSDDKHYEREVVRLSAAIVSVLCVMSGAVLIFVSVIILPMALGSEPTYISLAVAAGLLGVALFGASFIINKRISQAGD